MSTRPLRAPVLLSLVWLAGAVVATGVGVLAVGLVAQQVGDPAVAPLSAAAAGAAVPSSASTPAPATPTPAGAASATARPGPSPAPPALAARPPTTQTRTFRSAGGSAGLACSGTTARLLYVTPADGYALDEQSVSGSEAEVRFEGAGVRVRLELSCAGGQPGLLDERVDNSGGGSGSTKGDSDD